MKRNKHWYVIPMMLAMFALALAPMGCATGTSDRGNLGETPQAPLVQIGQIDNTGQPTPNIGVDPTTGFYTLGFDAIATEFDAQIAAIQTAIEAAKQSNDQATVATLSKKLATLQSAKTTLASARGGGGNVSYVNIGTLTISNSGTSSAASPGDTTQTPSTQTTPTATVDLTP